MINSDVCTVIIYSYSKFKGGAHAAKYIWDVKLVLYDIFIVTAFRIIMVR
jgi:hypothetical protein